MATMLWDRIVPKSKNAYFPFQMSASSLSPSATVYIANDASGADSTVGAGVSVDDMGGGLYSLKVLAANMTVDGVYYAVVTAGTESVRIPLWAYAPTGHLEDVLNAMGATGASGLFAETTNLYAEIKELQSSLATMQGNVTDILADTNELQADWVNGGRLDLILDNAAADALSVKNAVGTSADDSEDATVFGKIALLSAKVDTETEAIDSALSTMQGNVTDILSDTAEMQADLANGGRLDLIFDETQRAALAAETASENVESLVGLAVDDATDATLFGKIAALSDKVDTETGAIDSALGAYGDTAADETVFGEIERVRDALATHVAEWAVAGRLEASLVEAERAAQAAETSAVSADGKLGAFGDVVADETVFGQLAGIKVAVDEIGDISDEWAAGAVEGDPTNVGEALRKIYGSLVSSSDPWNDDLSTYTTVGTSGYYLREAHEELVDAAHGLAKIKEDTAQAVTDTTEILSRLGEPVLADFSADIAAIKSVVDTLQVTTNARLQPSVPSEMFSSVGVIRMRLGLSVFDGVTGALEDPDVLGTNGDANGQALIKVSNVGGGTAPALFEGSAGATGLSNTDAAGLTTWLKMKRISQGYFEAYAEIPAYFNKTVEISFLCKDSDPGVDASGAAVQQTFLTNRYMLVRSPVSASVGGGAF